MAEPELFGETSLLICVVQVILHGPAVVEKVFQSKEYEVFRSLSLVQSAISYARVSIGIIS